MNGKISKPRPNPEEFGREVLWHLCGARAEMRILLNMFARHVEPDISKADELYADWIKKAVETQQKFYDEGLERVGIPPSKE